MTDPSSPVPSRSAAADAGTTPVRIVLHQKSRVLEIEFADGLHARLGFEFLRVHSPSAEVRGHGPGQEVLQLGKQDVTIDALEPVGHYGIRPTFSDGHGSGIYTWPELHHLASHQQQLSQRYAERVRAAAGGTGAASADAVPAGAVPAAASSAVPTGTAPAAAPAASATPAAGATTRGAATPPATGFVPLSRPRP